jgi:pyridoxal phosphate enzyme (YggS family)
MLDTAALMRIKKEVGTGVTIVAATKNVQPNDIAALKSHGVALAGENRVQEFLSKYEHVSDIKWHFIGRLQTNKVKYIVDKVAMIQSVDRESLADEIDRQCAKIGRVVDVLIEVNTGEESKGGVDKQRVFELAEYVSDLPHVRLKGLMCIPRIDAPIEDYRDMRLLFDSLKLSYSGMEHLSMGMSGDYALAVDCGANMIRPGSVLFGKRGSNAF